MVETEKEIWRRHPDFDFIDGSNLGRVRTIDRTVMRKDKKKYTVKGRVLSQHRNPNGYMQATVRVNGKLVTLKIHRAIASCFLPNPSNLEQVNHKDNDRTNNCVDNLEWCNNSYNQRYREKHGVSQTKACGHPLFVFNLKTGEKLSFHSQMEASRKTGVNAGNISNVLKGKCKQVGGYYFTKNESGVTKEKLNEIKTSMNFLGGVIAIAMEKQGLLWFGSQSKAGQKLGVNQGHINEVIKSHRNQAGGYWFTRANENAVENTRIKFGDELAQKVDELMNKK